MNSNTLVNVEYILDKYSKHIKNDKQLVLLYWQQIDGVEMGKETISTTDFLHKATSELDIINAKILLEIMKQENI